MNPVEDYILSLDIRRQEIMVIIHQVLVDEYNLSPKIRFKIPMYYKKSWICYLNPIKNNGVELAFIHGKKLSNSSGILQDKGRKMVSGVDIYNAEEIPLEEIYECIEEAILMDEK